MLRLRDLELSVPLVLAPMASLTHSVLRSLIVELGGVGLLSTEMLSARRLPVENWRFSPYLVRTEKERPLAYQLLITKAEEVVPAMEALHRLGADVIDLNLGCPAPRIRQAGGGCALLDDPDRLKSIVRIARQATDRPLTAKIRLGESLHERRLRELCTLLAGEGLDMLTVHARLRKESFSRKPRWEWAAKVKSWLDIPVVVNGGIFTVEDARRCLQITGADGLMIGRAAAQKPWIFSEIAREVYGIRMPEQEHCLPLLYASFLSGLERFPPERRLGRLKEFTHYFARNYAFGHHLAMKVQASPDLERAWQHALRFFQSADPQGWEKVRDTRIRCIGSGNGQNRGGLK